MPVRLPAYVTVELHKEGGGTFIMETGSKQLVQSEYGPGAPLYVNAADYDDKNHYVILISGK